MTTSAAGSARSARTVNRPGSPGTCSDEGDLTGGARRGDRLLDAGRGGSARRLRCCGLRHCGLHRLAVRGTASGSWSCSVELLGAVLGGARAAGVGSGVRLTLLGRSSSWLLTSSRLVPVVFLALRGGPVASGSPRSGCGCGSRSTCPVGALPVGVRSARSAAHEATSCMIAPLPRQANPRRVDGRRRPGRSRLPRPTAGPGGCRRAQPRHRAARPPARRRPRRSRPAHRSVRCTRPRARAAAPARR